MNPKFKKQVTSAFLAFLMTVTTTVGPVTTGFAAEPSSVSGQEVEESAAGEPVYEGESGKAATEEGEEKDNTSSETVEGGTSAENVSVPDTGETNPSVAESVDTITEQIKPETEEEVSGETNSAGEETEEASANETRGPDEEAEETTGAAAEAALPFDVTKATREELLAYIESLGGNDSDTFYEWIDTLDEDSYDLLWISQYGNTEDVLSSEFGFDYDGAEDLDAKKWIDSLTEDEYYNVLYSMTFEQYKRYLSIREMVEEIETKDFSDVIEENEFTPDRTWDYDSFDAFAESLAGVSLQRTENSMQFYNTYVDPSKVQAGVTTIDSLLDSNADWYSDDYILSLNPQMFKETVPVYYGADGNYYVVSAVPALNAIESADYQPATSFYNGGIEAQAYTDISYLGNGVYRIPASRYKYCFTEQYVSDQGDLYGIMFGLRIQVLYGFTPSGSITLAADVLYPDLTERFLPAVLDLVSGTATVKVFDDTYEDTLDHYLISASINRGASLPESMGTMDGGKTLQFVVDDACAVGSLDVLIGYNVTSKYSMDPEVTTSELYPTTEMSYDINLAAELYNGAYLKVDKSSIPSNLAVGDKFVYANTGLTIVGVENAWDLANGLHVGASTIPTHDAQSFCFYNTTAGAAAVVSSWFKTQLNTTSADPGYMLQMTVANMNTRAAYNGTSTNLRATPNPTDATEKRRIFGYMTDALGSAACATDSSKVLNLEGTNILLSCMHAWSNESATTPVDVVNSVTTFTQRTGSTYAIDEGCGHYHPNVALQCTSITDSGNGYTNITFKVVTSMLEVRGIDYAENYQCAFSTIRVTYENPKTGYLQIHKTSANPEMTNGNSCYSFDEINYGIFSDSACVYPVAVVNLDANGYSPVQELTPGTYYIREATATPGSGYKTNATVYPVTVTENNTVDNPLVFETQDTPLNDPFGIVIEKVNSDGTTTADLSDAEYTIRYYAGQYTMSTLPTTATTTWVIKTVKDVSGHYQAYLDDAHIVSGSAVYGKNTAGSYVIPLGTITVQETKAPAGFTVDGAVVSSSKTGAALSGTNGVYLFNLVDENAAIYLKSGNALSTELSDEAAVTIRYAEVQNKGGIKVQKNDALTGSSTPSGDADLSGIRFAIINNTGSTVTNKDGKEIANGAVVQVITTNAAGYAATGAADLPIGSFIVKELRADASVDGNGNLTEGTSSLANASYLWKDSSKSVAIKDTDTGKLVDAGAFSDSPVTAVPVLEKYDLELNKQQALGGTTLAGITFEITNKSANAVVVGTKSYATGAVVATATSDASGKIAFTTALPCGTYSVKETKTNSSYTLTDGTAKTFTVKSVNGKGAVVYEDDEAAVIFKNRAVRGDLSFIKKDASNDQALAYVPFKITNNATGETHYILTGADGSYSSKTAVNTKNTNGNDAVLSAYGTTDIIPQSVINGLKKDAGLWFGGTSANDSYGALPYGTYTITELKTEATRSMNMVSTTVTIDSDGTVVDLGTIYNISVGLKTTLTDQDGDHYVMASGSLTLTDRVEYQNLEVGKSYVLKGTLYVKDGSSLTQLAVGRTSFTPSSSNGTADVTFTFDASALKGKSVVAYEELTLDGVLVAEHKEKDDEGQTVYFPAVKTTATAADTGDHITMADAQVTINDSVELTGLRTGAEYTLTGRLMDKSTGKALVIGGKEVTASETFTATGSSMTVTLTYTLDASALAGKTTVVFETLFSDGKEIASHADFNDAGQTVYFPSVGTSAKDKTTGQSFIRAEKNVTIVDTVSYTNLIPGKEYTVTGKLMNRAAGSALVIGGKEVTASKTFTPSTASGSVDVEFTFDASALAGTAIVVFESVTYQGVEVAAHADINDAGQTITVPGLQTTALDSVTEDHVAGAADTITITDTVAYSGLTAGQKYTVTGLLMDKATGKAVPDDNGEEITAEKTFTAAAASGSVILTFTFAGVTLAGKTLVAFETLTFEGRTFAVHADINDADQTVYIPKIRTKALDQTSGLNQVKADSNVTIVDTVTYTNLLPGRTYTVRGVLMTSAGNALMLNGSAVTAGVDFTPAASNGTVDVTFTFDASGLGGRKLVVFEYLYLDGNRIASHTDLSDADQTLYVPSIKTTVTDAENGSHSSAADTSVTVIDTVRYNGLEIGRSYTMTGTLVDKATGAPVLDDSGKKITSSTDFVPERTNGTVEVRLSFSGVSLAGKTVVAFESLYTEGKEVGVHADLRDESQTQYLPSVHTTATAADTADHVTGANEKVTITDQVAFKALKLGTEYTVSGTLMDVKTGKPILVNGNSVTARRTFTADAHEMIIALTYTLDASDLAGTTTVVFENLYSDGALLASHADVSDAEQTVYIPEIGTTAKDKTTQINHTEAKPQATIIDTVLYTSLLPGKEYTVTGKLMDKETGKEILIGGKPVTASTTFTPAAADGSVDVTFTFDASAIEGTTVVAFETLEYKGNEIAVHADIEDHDQTVYIPKIRTTAISDDTEDHVTKADETITLVDTVRYEGLEVGRTYTVTGKLMDKGTGKEILVGGKAVTASTTFTAQKAAGEVDVTFTFDGTGLEDTIIVVFETLYTEGKEVAVHADIEDESQSVYVPEIRTTVKDKVTEINHTEAKPQATIIDTVLYSSLLPGREYTVTGTLMNKATGKEILIGGKPVTASTTFTAEKASGSVDVIFTLDASALEGTTVVAFESLDYKGIEVAVHADITDKDQTVYIPKIRTTAISDDTAEHVTKADETITLIDTVRYEGLEVGRTYIVTGKLMDQAAGKEILIGGKAVTAGTTFTPKTTNGTVDVTFTFDGTGLEDTIIVVFETLYTEGKEVAVHADIQDEDQSVYVPEIRTTAKDKVTEINHTEAKPQATIIDTVLYSSLLPGKEYTVTGTLMNKATGKPVVIDGKEVTASTAFTAEKASGSVDVIFTFDASAIEGTTVVAFESLDYKGIEVAVHADIEDEDQTVYIPKIRTTVISDDTEYHVTQADETITLIDTVKFTSLEVGREYTVKGVLMDKATGKAILVDGKEAASETTFTPETTNGTVDVTFTFDGTGLEDTIIVVFETLCTEGKEVAVHADIQDEDQSVYVPEIRTTAKDKVTEINHTEAKPQATIIDTVLYSSLLPGKEYTVTGTLMNKATGEVILIDGEKVTASTTFTAEKAQGNVDVVFTFDASAIEGTTVVVFESLDYKGIEVAVHADIEDEDQTVYIPKIRTTAISDDTEDHVTKADETITLIDTVKFESLEIGREYTVKGVLIDKAAGEVILVDGKEVTSETIFTPETTDGTVDVTFTFDGTGFEDTLLVAYETLYTEGKEVAVHADIEDEEQSVYFPEIHTSAKDAVTEIDHTEALAQATIIDTVTYSHLLPGKEYTMTGTLMNKATGEPVLIGGEKVTASTTFIAEEAFGSVEVVFTFDASAIAGTTVVAFESLDYEGIEVAVHADIEDEDQTVYIPDIHTTATAVDTEDHVTGADETLTITDEVALTGLKVGSEYTLKGVLMDKATGRELVIDGEMVVSEAVFTAEQSDMTVTLVYELDASALAGTTTVVFETLYTEEKEVGRHTDITDEDQTVYIPEIHTTAADKETQINHTEAKEKAVIIDTVFYSHLLPGKEYTVTGTLMNKATGEPVLIDGEKVTASTAFTAEEVSGSVDVVFTFDAAAIAGTTVVAFESLDYEGIEVAVHADIEDEDQTVYIPEIGTTALAEDTDDHIEKAREEAVIVDTVSYSGLEVGRTYKLTGTLMDQETGEPLLVNDEEVTESVTFTAEAAEGSIEITFTFDASALAGKTLVVFETLYTGEKEVAVHADIEDEGQSIHVPEIHTTATDKATGDHDGVVSETTTVVDEVFYTNLIPGKEYTVTGKLMVKETGEPLVVDGEEVTASKTFTAEEADGSVILEFTFSSLALAGKHVVAFEDLTYEGISVAAHADIEDENQTVSYPSIRTTAFDQAGASKMMSLGGSVVLEDTVSYIGLTAGKTYVMKGTVVDKATGASIGVTGETTFTAEKASGSVEVVFILNTEALQGKTLVVFEALYDTNGALIADHSDLADEDQTVTVPVKPEIPPVVTGDDSTPVPYILALALTLFAALAVVLVLARRRKAR